MKYPKFNYSNPKGASLDTDNNSNDNSSYWEKSLDYGYPIPNNIISEPEAKLWWDTVKRRSESQAKLNQYQNKEEALELYNFMKKNNLTSEEHLLNSFQNEKMFEYIKNKKKRNYVKLLYNDIENESSYRNIETDRIEGSSVLKHVLIMRNSDFILSKMSGWKSKKKLLNSQTKK